MRVKCAEINPYVHRIPNKMAKYIYQYNNWPGFTWDENETLTLLGKSRHLQERYLDK